MGIFDFAGSSTAVLIAYFVAATLVIVAAGTRITGLADTIAARTGLGGAVVGGVLLGLVTSLSGVVVSISTALEGRAALAFANGVGGIAAQTLFLAIADLIYRRANLEHAAADIAILFQAALLGLLLGVPILAHLGPAFTVWGVHPASVVLAVGYVLGVRASARVRERPMWIVVETEETRTDGAGGEADDGSMGNARLYGEFAVLGLLLGLSGYVIGGAGGALATRIGLSETLVGALLTAVATSLPELVTTLAAVRRGALQLAVGGVIGGNTFDLLFLTASDVAYQEGSLYHAIGTDDLFWAATGLLMTGVLLVGLILREREGVGKIGFESALMIGIYALALGLQIVGG